MISAAIKQQVETKVNQCVAAIENKYKVIFKKPLITYNVRGTCGGKAHYSTWRVDFNPVLLNENLDHYLTDVIPHEVAHLATKLIYPHALQRTYGRKRSPHGDEWASIMVALGASPKRTHSMDVTNAKVRRTNTYKYVCGGCGYVFELGPKRHAKIQRGVTMWHPACGKGKGNLVLADAKSQVVKPATIVSKPVKSTVPTGETKLARCYRLFENYPGYSRAEMINVFKQECDMTDAGASTYYAKCKQMRG